MIARRASICYSPLGRCCQLQRWQGFTHSFWLKASDGPGWLAGRAIGPKVKADEKLARSSLATGSWTLRGKLEAVPHAWRRHAATVRRLIASPPAYGLAGWRSSLCNIWLGTSAR